MERGEIFMAQKLKQINDICAMGVFRSQAPRA